jgi:hypothetical protein
MPVDVVRLKAGRQKDGVKLLAGSYDATPKNLCKWVGKSELENVLKQYGPLPETFRELDEKELVELQSRTKIVFAIGAQNEISAIGSLVGRPNPLEFMNSPLFRHCNRIISMYYALQHDKGAGGYFLDGENLMRLMLWEQIPFDPLTFEVLAHDAFMVPSNIPAMLGGYCRKNPTKAETAI